MSSQSVTFFRDVDFSLDGDLDKISSFRVDISDLDISSPPKKAGKPKERSKEESAGGNHQQKRDRFTFPFDFNEFDTFNFESSLVNEGMKSNKNKNSEEALNRRECQGSRIDLSDCISASVSKSAASGGVATSKIENLAGGLGDADSVNKSCPPNAVPNDNGPSKSVTVQNQMASEEIIALPEKTRTTPIQEIDVESHHHQENITFPEPYAQQILQDLSIQSASENEPTQDTASEIQVEVCSMATEPTSKAGGDQNVNLKSLNCEDSLLERSPPHNIARSLSKDGKKNGLRSSNVGLVGTTDGTEPAQGDTSTTSITRESMQGEKAKRDNQNANKELHLAPLSNGTLVNISNQVKKNATSVVQSKFFKRQAEKESQQNPSTQTKLTVLGGKKNGAKQQTSEGRERFDSDALHGSRLIVPSRLHDLEVTNSESGQGSEENVRNLITLSSSELRDKPTTQNCTTPKLPSSSTVSIKSSKNICGEGNTTLTPLKADRNLLDISKLKISRTLGVNHHPLSSTFQKQINSLRNTKHSMELQGSASSNAAHSVGTEKQTPSTPSLKRKTFEDNNENLADSNVTNSVKDCQTFTLDIPRVGNLTELQIPLVLENDDYVEKAEAYTKELEDVMTHGHNRVANFDQLLGTVEVAFTEAISTKKKERFEPPTRPREISIQLKVLRCLDNPW
ncbi:hypothetical protein U1Q18_009296 [Sarracenia purpurea var. burkii]